VLFLRCDREDEDFYISRNPSLPAKWKKSLKLKRDYTEKTETYLFYFNYY
jgi:hypothetical protein